MRYPLGYIASCAVLLGLPTAIVAKDDPNYDPSENYRPNNITGLSAFYVWIGSYYNATTEVELKPVMGEDINDTLCPNLKDYTATAKFDSILSITQRGAYNSGNDPFNFWLSFIPPHLNLSSILSGPEIQFSPIQWPILSSSPNWKGGGNYLGDSPGGDGLIYDHINFTLAKSQEKLYNFSTTVNDTRGGAVNTFSNITMPACNITDQTGDWQVSVFSAPWWSTEGWDTFKLPRLSVQFDDKTANLTLDADFSAYPYRRLNATGEGQLGPGVQGTVKIRFSGVLDAYHSDSLNTDSKAPTWLRTVGFGNDTSNIGYGSGSDRPCPGLALPVAAILCVAAAVYF